MAFLGIPAALLGTLFGFIGLLSVNGTLVAMGAGLWLIALFFFWVGRRFGAAAARNNAEHLRSGAFVMQTTGCRRCNGTGSAWEVVGVNRTYKSCSACGGRGQQSKMVRNPDRRR